MFQRSDRSDNDTYTDIESNVGDFNYNLNFNTIFINENMKFNKNEFNEQNLCKVLASMHRILCAILANQQQANKSERSHDDLNNGSIENDSDFSDLTKILNDISSKLWKTLESASGVLFCFRVVLTF